MERLHCSYQELLQTPEHVIEDVMLVIEAEGKAANAAARQGKEPDGRNR